MKKIIALVVAVAMVASLGFSALAAVTVPAADITATGGATIAVDGDVAVLTYGDEHEWGNVSARFTVDLGAPLSSFTSVTVDYEGLAGDVGYKRLSFIALPEGAGGWLNDNDNNDGALRLGLYYYVQAAAHSITFELGELGDFADETVVTFAFRIHAQHRDATTSFSLANITFHNGAADDANGDDPEPYEPPKPENGEEENGEEAGDATTIMIAVGAALALLALVVIRKRKTA